jgi:hypothetical protein
MHRTIFSIAKTDCASEEQLVRMKLASVENVESLSFELQKRILEVIHSNGHEIILRSLDELKLNTVLVSTEPIADVPFSGASHETKLYSGALINLSFFVIEIVVGETRTPWDWSQTAWTMLRQHRVWTSLYTGKSTRHKKRVAATSRYFQMFLAPGIL